MKKLMILISLVGLTGMVNAQTEKKKEGLTNEQRAEKMTAKMKKSLNLTDEQILKVKEANLNFVKERENMQLEVRQYLPKGMDFSELTPQKIYFIQEKLNHRPRKKLGYRTPYEVFYGLFAINS